MLFRSNQETQIYQIYNRNNELGFFRFRNVWISLNRKQNSAKKIIATTDNSLELPQPPQQFSEEFIEEYNQENIITDVLVEYENKFDGKEYVDELDAYGYDKVKSILKINRKDNNITIKIAKDSWSREEVIEFANKVKEYCENGWKSDSLHRVFFEWDKWIEENL